MPVGNVTETIRDGGLGIIPSTTSGQHVVLGVASLGTVNTLYSFSTNEDIQATVGVGPGPEAAAFELSYPNSGGQIYFMPVTASVVGVSTAVTPTRVGASTGTVSISGGTPLDAYQVNIKIVSLGVGQLVTGTNVAVQVSLDNGQTYSPTTLVPASGTFVLTGTGLTLAFSVAASTFDFGDQFAFTCQAPFYGSSDITSAMTALGNDVRTWGFLHLVGFPTVGASGANATSSAALAATLSTNLATFANNFRYVRAIMDAPPSADSDLQAQFLNFVDGRVMVVAGTDVLTSALSGRKYTRSHAWATSGRLGGSRVSTSPGRTADGPLPGIVSLLRDERKQATQLFDQRFSVALTYLGQNGFYSDIGRTMSALGSDFSFIMNGRVMDQACVITRQALFQFLNTAVRVNPTTSGQVGQPGGPGTIFESDARGIESFVEKAIRNVMSADITDVSVKVNRTDNLISTNLLRVTTRITPFAYASSISEDIGFVNPALVLT